MVVRIYLYFIYLDYPKSVVILCKKAIKFMSFPEIVSFNSDDIPNSCNILRDDRNQNPFKEKYINGKSNYKLKSFLINESYI